MQPTTIAARPHYHRRPHRPRPTIPRGRQHGDLADPLALARGIMIGIPLSAALWAGIVAVLRRFLD